MGMPAITMLLSFVKNYNSLFW